MAVTPGVSREKHEFFIVCALVVGDGEVDKHGFINPDDSKITAGKERTFAVESSAGRKGLR